MHHLIRVACMHFSPRVDAVPQSQKDVDKLGQVQPKKLKSSQTLVPGQCLLKSFFQATPRIAESDRGVANPAASADTKGDLMQDRKGTDSTCKHHAMPSHTLKGNKSGRKSLSLSQSRKERALHGMTSSEANVCKSAGSKSASQLQALDTASQLQPQDTSAAAPQCKILETIDKNPSASAQNKCIRPGTAPQNCAGWQSRQAIRVDAQDAGRHEAPVHAHHAAPLIRNESQASPAEKRGGGRGAESATEGPPLATERPPLASPEHDMVQVAWAAGDTAGDTGRRQGEEESPFFNQPPMCSGATSGGKGVDMHASAWADSTPALQSPEASRKSSHTDKDDISPMSCSKDHISPSQDIYDLFANEEEEEEGVEQGGRKRLRTSVLPPPLTKLSPQFLISPTA
jgi:hypothetical protein